MGGGWEGGGWVGEREVGGEKEERWRKGCPLIHNMVLCTLVAGILQTGRGG